MINYKKSKFENEMDEFDRVVSQFSNGTDPDWDYKMFQIKQIYTTARVSLISTRIWQILENTDSYHTDTREKIMKAIKSNSASSGKRDIDSVIKEYESNSVRAPILLSYEGGRKYTLVAGNTRLMVAKMMGINPKVLILKTSWK